MRVQNNVNYCHPNFGIKVIDPKGIPVELRNKILESPIVKKLDGIAPDATVELFHPGWPCTEYTLIFDTKLPAIEIISSYLKSQNTYGEGVTKFYITHELPILEKHLKEIWHLNSFLDFREQCIESNQKHNK